MRKNIGKQDLILNVDTPIESGVVFCKKVGFLFCRRCFMDQYFLAIDIGASSGRHIVGWLEEGQIKTEEVYRFSNGMETLNGSLVWNVESIFNEVLTGMALVFEKYKKIESVSIDTWAVDYVLLNDNEPILPCYAYRDKRTEPIPEAIEKIVSFAELYSRTGIQFQPFNTIYQLYADKLTGRLEEATDFLMVPEYLLWRLSGVKVKEYTNATSTGLVNANTKEYDDVIVEKLALPKNLFTSLSQPPQVLAELLPEMAERVGGQTKVVLCATHDTASAVEGIPMRDDALFLSSGTWSLLGAKLANPVTSDESREANFTNEGGVGYIRYLKNIMGLWIVQCLQKQMEIPFEKMVELAQSSKFVEIFDVNDARFSAPLDMREEIASALVVKDISEADLLNSVYHSLAYSYGEACREIEHCTGKKWDTLYIAGGGAKNEYLNQLTQEYTKKNVIPLAIEATALGNLKLQMELCK